jgi:CHAD domain-containing protein
MSQNRADPPDGKWVQGVSPEQRLFEAARRILDARLNAVCYWLPLAAEKPQDDVEYVHQLRVASRRAVEAVRVFSDLLPVPAYQDIRTKLRQVRLAADEARNLDVLCGQILRRTEVASNGCSAKVLEQFKGRRRRAQQPIVKTYQELRAEKLDDRISELLEEVCAQQKAKAKGRFGKQAPRYLKPALTKFFKAADADLSSDEAFHDLRIRAKKLRYTMEILAAAFAPGFRKKLYPELVLLQDMMGAVNDHATAETLFGEWLVKSQDVEQRALLQGMLFAEEKAHQDLRQAFLVILTPKTVAKLRRQFRKYSGLP